MWLVTDDEASEVLEPKQTASRFSSACGSVEGAFRPESCSCDCCGAAQSVRSHRVLVRRPACRNHMPRLQSDCGERRHHLHKAWSRPVSPREATRFQYK